jgi:hypothetical protein
MLVPLRLPDTQHVAFGLERRHVRRFGSRVLDAEHDVDDRLRQQAGNGGRASVLDQQRSMPKCLSDSNRFARE